MIKIYRFLTVAIFAFLLSSVISCSETNSSKKDIIGKWTADDGSTLEFLKDGAVISVKKGTSSAGNYKFLPDGRLKMDIGGPSGSKIFEVSFDKEGRLNLKEPAGEVSRYLSEKAYKAKLDARKRAEEAARKSEEEKIKANFVFFDLTVLDKTTKLMWTRDGYLAGKAMTWNDAFNFIKKLNERKYAGYSDWRLPVRKELETLPNFVKSNGVEKEISIFFIRIGFKDVQSSHYWSSSTFADNINYAWIVNMWDGNVYYYNKSYHNYYVWPVRAGQ